MNLFKKVVATVALSAVVISTSALSVSAYSDNAVASANTLAGKGIINDHSNDVAGYNLAANIMRNEISKVAANISGTAAKTVCSGSFSDVSATNPNTWTCGYVEGLLDAGLVSANSTFRPLANISKSEATKLMLDAAGCENFYTNAATWQAETVAFAAENGIVSSFADYNAPAQRGFIFEVAANAMEVCPVDADDDLLNVFDNLINGDDDTTSTGTTDTTSTGTTDTTDTTDDTSSTESTVMVTLSPESPANGNVAVNTPRVAMLAFDVVAGTEDVKLKEVTLDYTGLNDSHAIDNVTVYKGNESVSKTKNFSDNDLDISFDKNTVVKAGERVTFTVRATVSGSGIINTSHQLTLSNLDASATVEGDSIVGASLVPVQVTNKAELEVTKDTASEKVTIGESVKLAGFKIEEKADNEDVIIKSITFTVSGSIDAEDDLSDLVLFADNKEIASDLTVNSDDEIIANLDYTIPADEKVEFKLEWVVTGSVNDNIQVVFENDDDIYAVGATTGINIAANVASIKTKIADAETIEGSEINISFDKSDIDEAKPDAQDVLVGTLKVTAATDDYTINKLTVTVSSAADAALVIEDMELAGSSYDKVASGVYTFEDIDLTKGETLSLPLTFNVNEDTALNGKELTFTVKVTEVEDDENDVTYTSTADLNTVLSSNAFDNNTIKVESASFTLNETKVNDREIVLGNGIETVVYKAKISVWDSDDVKVKNFDVTMSGASTLTEQLDDIIDSATLTIGGKSFDGDVDADSIDFSSIDAVVAAGSDNVEVLVTVVLKDNDSVTNNQTLIMELLAANVELEDSEGEDLVAANITLTTGSKDTKTTLRDRGTLEIAVVNNGDLEDDIEDTILAGSTSVALAEIEYKAEYEDVKVKELVFRVAGDMSDTIKDAKIVAEGGATIVEGAVVTFDGANTLITFKNDFVLTDSDTTVSALLVADLNPITDQGDETSAKAGNIVVSLTIGNDIDAKWVNSNDDLVETAPHNVASTAVAVVPAIVTTAVTQKLATGQEESKATFTIDKGSNEFDPDEVAVVSIEFTSISDVANIDYVQNDDGDALVFTVAGKIITFTGTPALREIKTGDEIKIVSKSDAATETTKLEIAKNGVTYNVNSADYATSNDKVIDLGKFKNDAN